MRFCPGCTRAAHCSTDGCGKYGLVVKGPLDEAMWSRRVFVGTEPFDRMLRESLRDFAVLMERKLKKNDHKTAWRDLPVEALFRQLLIELEEFKVADEFLSVLDARAELVDLANFCLILHDRLGLLDLAANRHTQKGA